MGPEMFLADMAGQWQNRQMIPLIDWKGTLNKTEKNVWARFDPGQRTTSGVCSWIGPLSKKPDEMSANWPKGAISGENNGMTILLDAESYDYVENDKPGIGFRIAITHPLDMPIIEQSAVSVKPGTATELAVSATLTTTSEDAIQRFNPYERKCWKESEISFQFVPYDEQYHYSMSNCLFESVMQEANRTCKCIPGYIRLTNQQCFGKSLKCFNDIVSNLGNNIRP